MTAVMEAPTTEPKIVVLVRLLNAIDEGTHSFESLKDRVAEGGRRPSTRSLRRYLAILTDAGFPLHFDRARNAYRFAGGYSLKRLALSDGELFGLVALRSLGASIGGAIGSSIDDVTEKLVGTAGRTARARADSLSPVTFRLAEIRLDSQGERAFSLLSAAERASRSVRFSYLDKDGNASSRTIDPYGFVIHAGRVYCVGFDHDRRDKRTFAVDSVAQPDVLGSTFLKPDGFSIEQYVAGSISGVMHRDQTTAISVRFAARVAKAAIAARVVEERQVERHDDGGVEITYSVTDTEELVRWVLGWGAEAEIVAPRAARARIAALSQEILGKY
jgi:predicted DNA-binding transcriptional regulator YafY